jgi:serine/threonine protein kinase
VHRDLKCSNILVDQHDCIKVSDFGLSKHASSGGNTRMGTLNWIAPEILRNAGPFTEKADVFSYGIVVWEIFTNGQVPYQGLQPLQIVRAIDEGVRPEM